MCIRTKRDKLPDKAMQFFCGDVEISQVLIGQTFWNKSSFKICWYHILTILDD